MGTRTPWWPERKKKKSKQGTKQLSKTRPQQTHTKKKNVRTQTTRRKLEGDVAKVKRIGNSGVGSEREKGGRRAILVCAIVALCCKGESRGAVWCVPWIPMSAFRVALEGFGGVLLNEEVLKEKVGEEFFG